MAGRLLLALYSIVANFFMSIDWTQYWSAGRPESRRSFLSTASTGLAGIAASRLLMKAGLLQAEGQFGTRGATPPHQTANVKQVIHIVLCGGLSQVDTFDYKPALERAHGQSLPGDERPDVFFGQVGRLKKNDWAFQQRGQSGLWISDLFPHLAGIADELTVIRSMFAETSNHTPATFQENTGFRLNGFPVAGSWLSYGLGSETDDLPAYVVIPDPRGYPAGGSINWTNGFLPARHQGVPMRARGQAIDDLFPARPITASAERAGRGYLARLNQRHAERRQGDDVLSARIRSYELAARMQLAVPEVSALETEPASIQSLYGLERPECVDFGRGCLLARRLLERGVRFVQMFSGGAFGSPRINWDGHEDMVRNHGREALRIDQPIAGLLKDLRLRGMLDETLVLFTSEFGRTPFAQSKADEVGRGRDHNQYGFSVWLAGGGLKRGFSYGATDELGLKAVDNRVDWYDFYATVLHQLGLNHERLTYYHNGIQRRLTNVHGSVIKPLLA